jgi:hypothetical protein
VLTVVFYHQNYSGNPKTIQFVDDARVIISNSNFKGSVKFIDMVLKNVNVQFSYNLLYLYFGKTHFMQLIT